MQAIVTKYLGPTNNRPSRIKVFCDAKSMTVSWDHGRGPDANHRRAVAMLALDLGWSGEWVTGSAPQKGSPHAVVAVCVRRFPDEGGPVLVDGLSARDLRDSKTAWLIARA